MTVRGVLWRSFAGSLALTPVVACGLRAQGVPDRECQRAAIIIAKGHPAETDDWAFGALSGCGVVGANAFAAGLAHYTTETNIAALEDFMTSVDSWRDATIFDAVMQLATNSAASPQARVFAVRHLILRLNPQFVYTYGGRAVPRLATARTPDGLGSHRESCG